MEIRIDRIADAAYIRFTKGKVAKTKNNGDHLADYDKKGNLIGFEILHFSRLVPKQEKVTLSQVIDTKRTEIATS